MFNKEIGESPEQLGKYLFSIHTHAELCDPNEIVYKEKDIIALFEYIGLKIKFKEDE